MPDEHDRLTWTPEYAQHVTGAFDRRVWDPVLLKHEPQTVFIVCKHCGATHQVVCAQGRPLGHIATFARVHLHTDPLAPATR